MRVASDLAGLHWRVVDDLVRLALTEDAPWGDLTSETLIPASARISAELVAREDGVLCGAQLFSAAMLQSDAGNRVEFLVADGAVFQRGQTLATIVGSARSVLTAERVALNFIQRLSGIATMTSKYVAAVAGTKARIVDTRKTTPGLRIIERYAVRCGGGLNHRFSLSDAVMVKDNHLAVVTQNGARDLTEALREVRQKLSHTAHLEVEVDRLNQIAAVLAADVDTIMLDNFNLDDLRAGVDQIAGRALVEASGTVRLETVAAIAGTGVDIISVGALTHSARSLDLGLDVAIETGTRR